MTQRDDRRPGGIVSAVIKAATAQAGAAGSTPPPDDRAALFAAVKSVRTRAQDMGVGAIIEAITKTSDTTRKQYKQIIGRRLPATGPDLAGLSRASFYPTRAALKAGLAGRINNAMKAQDKAQRAGDYAEAGRLVKIAVQSLDQLAALEAVKPPPAEKVKESARKRLPKAKGGQWQAKVYDAATPTMRPAIAVLWATGARPAEIEKGVDVERVAGGLRVRIPGAKVNDDKHSGQPVRVLLVKEDTPAGRALLAALGDAQKTTIQRKADRISKDFLDHIRPRLPASYRVSAYSFRHQTAANLKADLGDPSKVAEAMGHRSTRSQQHYGTKRQSQAGGGAVLDARATHKPKETRGLVLNPPVVGRPSGPSHS